MTHSAGIYNFNRVEGTLRSYSYSFNDSQAHWQWEVDGNNDGGGTWLVIDTASHEAFAHWVYESAIYLPLYELLQTIPEYAGIRLLLRAHRTYKAIFADYFDVQASHIDYYSGELPAGGLSGIFLFPEAISCLNVKSPPSLELQEQLGVFWEILTETPAPPIPLPSTRLLVLPRQTKENYGPNDRTEPLMKITDIPGCTVLHTDSIRDLQHQIWALRSATETVVLTDGSPFLVNGVFITDRRVTIALIGSMTSGQRVHYPKLDWIARHIESRNSVVRYSSEEEFLAARQAKERCAIGGI